MEFLFTNQIASIEAMIILACVMIVWGIFAYDGFFYLQSVYRAFFPKRTPLTLESIPPSPASTIDMPVSPMTETLEPIPENTIVTEIGEVILDNPILYPSDTDAPSWESLIAELEVVAPIEVELSQVDPITLLTEDILPQEISETPVDIAHMSENIALAEVSTPESEPSLSAWVEDPLPTGEVVAPMKTEQPEEISETHHEKKKAVHPRVKHEDEPFPEEKKKKSHMLKPEKREKVIEIINNVKTLIARGQIDEARWLIVSGLAIDKDNRDLNLIMASLYERDHAFEKAEYILKDIATIHTDDIEVLTHLATDLAMQRKYEVSYELYKKILSLDGEREETLYTLTHLASEMGLVDDVTTYARAYLKQYPHNPEILWLYSQSQIAHGERREAVDTLIKLKNLTPYNQEIADLIQKLMTEEELAGNFGSEK